MSIDWDRFIRRDRRTLMFAGIISLAASFALLFIYLNREKVKSKNDITFVSGPFDEYSWTGSGGRNGSSLTFRLQNYSNDFTVKADFFSILKSNAFKTISHGDTLTIGISNNSAKYLGSPKDKFLVYSISSAAVNYLDLDKAIAKHNSKLFLVWVALLFLCGCALIYFGFKAKE